MKGTPASIAGRQYLAGLMSNFDQRHARRNRPVLDPADETNESGKVLAGETSIRV